ncbi:MAG: hypothetical protein SGI74_13355, partial [Oligoflexia bacterium]|nr:hypothetical protein [Oligoflexia bacterium]
MSKSSSSKKDRRQKEEPKASPAKKKKTVRKLQVVKLEDRIAPSMVSGLVDPGAAQDMGDDDDRSQKHGKVVETSLDGQKIDKLDHSGANQHGQDNDSRDKNDNSQRGQHGQGGAHQHGGDRDNQGEHKGQFKDHSKDFFDKKVDTGSTSDDTESDKSAAKTLSQVDTAVATSPENNSQEPSVATAAQGLNQSADSISDTSGQDYVDQEVQSWKESEWATPLDNGSVQLQPPEGMTIDEGIANFPVDAANDFLPLPEAVQIQEDGSLKVDLPEGTQILAESNTVILPPDTVKIEQIPVEFNAFVNPDGSTSVVYPFDGVTVDAQSNTLVINNELANEIAPSYVEIQDDGSVDVTLPPETVVLDSGELVIPAESLGYLDTPVPESLSELDFATANADGSVSLEVPSAVVVDEGIAVVPHAGVDGLLALPENVTINNDGSMDVKVPEGTTYDSETNALTIPPEEIKLGEIPQGVVAITAPDGSVTVTLPDGMSYDAAASTVTLDNYWANEVVPDAVVIQPNGSVAVELPPETQVSADGKELTIAAEYNTFLDISAPDYVHDSSFAIANGDGSYTVTPPQGVEVVNGQLQFSASAVPEQLPLPENITLSDEGTMLVAVPEGSVFNQEENSITLPAESVHMAEVPEAVAPVLNEDGTITAYLQNGMTFNEDTGVIEVDNYWTNELIPTQVEVQTDGSVMVALPSDTEIKSDGSFIISAESSTFLEEPQPDYAVNGPEWVTVEANGAVTVEPLQGVQVNAETGIVTMSVEVLSAEFSDQILGEVEFKDDGTMEIVVPQGTTFDANENALTFSAASINISELPSQVEVYLNPDGTATAYLPDGMTFDANTGTIQVDNYWVNEFVPPSVYVTTDGQVLVDMPATTQFYSDGSFTIPTADADFINSPEPDYVLNGPEWITSDAAGSITVEPPAEVVVDPEAGTATIPLATVNAEFAELIPENLTLNIDGSASIATPEGTVFDAATNTIQMPPGSVHLYEIPSGIQAGITENGTVIVVLQPGMSFDATTGNVRLENNVVNQILPPMLQVQPSGHLTVTLPAGTQYHSNGSFTVPAPSANFVSSNNYSQTEQSQTSSRYNLRDNGHHTRSDFSSRPDRHLYSSTGRFSIPGASAGTVSTPSFASATPAADTSTPTPSSTPTASSSADSASSTTVNPNIESTATASAVNESATFQNVDFASTDAEGSVTITPPTDMSVNTESGVVTMPVEVMNEAFAQQIPEEITLNDNGTMTV